MCFPAGASAHLHSPHVTFPVPVCAGTVTNVKEASTWLSYTYLYVRMMQNPLPYGVTWQELAADPRLDARRFCFLSLSTPAEHFARSEAPYRGAVRC